VVYNPLIQHMINCNYFLLIHGRFPLCKITTSYDILFVMFVVCTSGLVKRS